MYRLIAFLIGYLIGTIQTAYFIGKLKGIDIREHGSKNAGMTNVTRTIGKRAGAFVFVVDILKGFAAFLIASLFFSGEGTFFSVMYCTFDEYDYATYHNCIVRMLGMRHCLGRGVLPGIYAGLGAVLGHCFPVWLKFRGGKGVSCALALILMIDWRVALIAFAAGFIIVAVSRYISLASLVITSLVPFLMWFLGFATEAVALMAGLTALIWFMHRENIIRLANGTERKFLAKRS